jgi:hypothetical protein
MNVYFFTWKMVSALAFHLWGRRFKPQWELSQCDSNPVLMWKDYRPYSKSSLTLNEWRFNLSFSRVSMLFLNSRRVSSHIVRYDTSPPAIQKDKNNIDTWEKLRLNLHSLSVSELLEYRRKSQRSAESRGFYPGTPVSSHRESWQGGLGKKGPQ